MKSLARILVAGVALAVVFAGAWHTPAASAKAMYPAGWQAPKYFQPHIGDYEIEDVHFYCMGGGVYCANGPVPSGLTSAIVEAEMSTPGFYGTPDAVLAECEQFVTENGQLHVHVMAALAIPGTGTVSGVGGVDMNATEGDTLAHSFLGVTANDMLTGTTARIGGHMLSNNVSDLKNYTFGGANNGFDISLTGPMLDINTTTYAVTVAANQQMFCSTKAPTVLAPLFGVEYSEAELYEGF